MIIPFNIAYLSLVLDVFFIFIHWLITPLLRQIKMGQGLGSTSMSKTLQGSMRGGGEGRGSDHGSTSFARAYFSCVCFLFVSPWMQDSLYYNICMYWLQKQLAVGIFPSSYLRICTSVMAVCQISIDIEDKKRIPAGRKSRLTAAKNKNEPCGGLPHYVAP
jgi:hypothetical protein